jgi:hypothetical protein
MIWKKIQSKKKLNKLIKKFNKETMKSLKCNKSYKINWIYWSKVNYNDKMICSCKTLC